MLAFAIVLMLGAAAAWIATADVPAHTRQYLRLAAVLEASLALSAAIALATPAATAIVLTLVAPLLAAAAWGRFFRALHPVLVSLLLACACVAGIAASATGLAVLSAMPQVIAVAVIGAIARPAAFSRARLYLVLGAVSLLGAAACALGVGGVAQMGVLLFSAAGLLGITLASEIPVEQRQKADDWLSIGRGR